MPSSCRACGGITWKRWTTSTRWYPAASLNKTEPWIDAFAERWSEARTGTCVAALDGTRGAVEDAVARSCLAQRRVALEEALATLEEPHGTAVEYAVELVAELPEPSRCHDPSWLSQAASLPGHDLPEEVVIRIARDKGMVFQERSITRDELYVADEVFLTGTAAEVTPIREIDRRTIGNGSRGPVTKLLQTAFFDVVSGRDSKYERWLDYV